MSSKRIQSKIAAVLLVASFLTAGGPALSNTVSATAAKQESASTQSLFAWAKEDAGLLKAAKQGAVKVQNQKVTKDGITLKLTDYLYDGARVSFALQREGNDLEATLDDLVNSDKKGVLLYSEVYVNGKKQEQSSYGRLSMKDGNSLVISFNDQSSKGPRTVFLPNQFELMVKAYVSGVKDPFTFKVPVKKQAAQNTVLNKAVVKKTGNLSYTVKRVELTPYSSRLEIIAQGSHKLVKDLKYLRFDIADNKGTIRTPLLQTWDGVVKNQRYFDMTYASFAAAPSSVVVKPYSLETDGKRAPKKVYLQDSELTLSIKK